MAMWLWSADALFRQLSSDHNIDVYHQGKCRLQAPTLARKFEISYWLSCGFGRTGRYKVTWLPNLFMYGGVERCCYTSAMFKLYSMHYDSYLIPMKIIKNLSLKMASRKYNKNITRTTVLWSSLRVCCTIYNYVRRYYNIKPFHSHTKW